MEGENGGYNGIATDLVSEFVPLVQSNFQAACDVFTVFLAKVAQA
jgi:hypothetical protein